MDKKVWVLLLAVPLLLMVQLELSWMRMTELREERDHQAAQVATVLAQLNATATSWQASSSEQLGKLVSGQEEQLEQKLKQLGEVEQKLLVEVQRVHAAAQAPDETMLQGPAQVAAACGRQQDVGRLGSIQWVPRKGRYLLALCTGGQMSNRLMCIRQNMVNAAALNRTLVLPLRELDYDYTHLIDLAHFKTCFGANSLLTLEEFRALPESAGSAHVDVLLCHIQKWQADDFCRTLIKRFEKDLGATFTEAPEVVRPPPRFSMKLAALRKKFGGRERVVAFANMFGVALKDAPLNSAGGGPLYAPPTCRSLLQPSQPIMQAARGFANSLLGRDFAAVHLRRGDFFQHCMEGDARDRKPPCFLPMPQVARCLTKRLSLLENASVVFLATDGEVQEIAELQDLVQGPGGRRVPLVQLPPITSQAWAKSLVSKKIHKDPQVIAILTKAVCGLAHEFYGSWTSTFSGDIHRLRDWWQTSTCRDSGICDQQDGGDFVQLPWTERFK